MNINLEKKDPKEELKKTTSNVFLLYFLVRGTMSNLGFTNEIDGAQLSGICFNKTISKLQSK